MFVSPTIGSRREYDRALRGLYHSDGTNDFKWSYGGADRQKRRQHRDPFAQFNDVFRNDPFFAEAFKSMDDLFDKHFSNNGGGGAQPKEGRDVDTSKDEGGGGMIWNMVKGIMLFFYFGLMTISLKEIQLTKNALTEMVSCSEETLMCITRKYGKYRFKGVIFIASI